MGVEGCGSHYATLRKCKVFLPIYNIFADVLAKFHSDTLHLFGDITLGSKIGEAHYHTEPKLGKFTLPICRLLLLYKDVCS